MDRFEDLRAFVQVVESGSLTRAAQALQVATSAVSRRIKELESRLGAQLLQRTTRQMRLTAAGETFHSRAVEILQSLAEAEVEAGDQGRSLAGPLRVAAPLSFGHSHLTPILIDFAASHPELDLDVDLSDRMVDLIAEGLDLAIRIGTLRDSTLVARKLATVRTVVVGAPSFWAERGRPVSAADLARYPLLRYTGSVATDRVTFRNSDGQLETVELSSALRSNNGDLLIDAAVAGLGYSISPSFIAQRACEAGLLEPVLTDHPWPTIAIHVVFPQTRHLSARARALIDFLRERIGPTPDWETFIDR